MSLMVREGLSSVAMIHTLVKVLISILINNSEIVSYKIDLKESNLIVIAIHHPPNNNLSYADPL